MVQYLKENFKMVKDMDKEKYNTNQEQFSKVILKMIWNKENVK